MESNFKDIRELTRALQMGSRLLSDMFSKRKTLRTIRYDDALEVLDGDEVKLRSLIAHSIIIDTDGALELDDVYLQFFENVLEVNEDVNVASVQAYIGKLRLNIDSYLAADTDNRRAQFLREVRHLFRSIAQMTHRNIIDLKRNVEDTYKQEPNIKLKKLRLQDFDEKRKQIAQLISQTEKIIDEQPIFFTSAMDESLKSVVNDVRRSLHESSHGLIDVEKQIIEYLNRIEYQSRLVRKLRQLKYLKNQFMLEDNTNIREVLSQRNEVWMEPQPKYVTKVSLDFLRNDDTALAILAKVRRQMGHKAVLHERLSGPISDEYLSEKKVSVVVYDHQSIFNAFKAQSNDLFSFIMAYPLAGTPTEEDRLVLFLQLASQFTEQLSFTGQMQETECFEYPIIQAI